MFSVLGVRFTIWDVGFWGFGALGLRLFRVWRVGFGVEGSGYRVRILGFGRVKGLGCRALRCQVQLLGMLNIFLGSYLEGHGDLVSS